MKREQIIEILEKYKDIESWYFFGQESEHKALINLASPENIADEILALPLDLPSDGQRIAEQSEYLTDAEERAFYSGQKWMREEIIKRNK